jgi:very-short-patch-repair endonuclease/DNA polymerase III delta prime subunit
VLPESSSPTLSSENVSPIEQTRTRVGQIFRYLQALDQLRNPVKRQVREQQTPLRLLDLPYHSSIVCPLRDLLLGQAGQESRESLQSTTVTKGISQKHHVSDDSVSATSEEDPSLDHTIENDIGSSDSVVLYLNSSVPILTVNRPVLTPHPTLPEVLIGWVVVKENPADAPKCIPERTIKDSDISTHSLSSTSARAGDANVDVVTVEDFEASGERRNAWSQWKVTWETWAESERPARQAMQVYEQLYGLHAQITRESERLDLVLGDGVLSWKRPEGQIHHPLLLQRLELHFDSEKNQFALTEADYGVEFYGALFRGMTDIHGHIIGAFRDGAGAEGVGPLGDEATDKYLAALASQLNVHGEFVGSESLVGQTTYPRVAREPWIFIRQRTLGFTNALESILTSLETGGEIPASLINVVGGETTREGIPPAISQTSSSNLLDANEDHTVLLSKAANEEQLAIARRLDEHGNVLVQGPPGTGKTHTISNLIGHLLAQGKTVLVTSHTTKALRVLRDQVVAPLQPLCVSVLDSDTESRQYLQTSVNAIVERISKSAVEELEKEADILARERSKLINGLAETRSRLLEARSGEFRDIIIQGTPIAPSQAAREVAVGREALSWIPGPITSAQGCPLVPEELIALYASNESLPPEQEYELDRDIPEATLFFPLEIFNQFVVEENYLKSADTTSGQGYWRTIEGDRWATIEPLQERALSSVQPLGDEAPWKLVIITAGQAGGAERDIWENLVRAIESVRDKSLLIRESFLTHGPALATDIDIEEQEVLLDEIRGHIQNGGNLNAFTLLLHRSWKPMLDKVQVGGKTPNRLEHFEVLHALAQLVLERRQLMARWDRQMTPIGAPSAQELGIEAEMGAAQFIPLIRECLDWRQNVWGPIEAELVEHGLNWTALIAQTPPVLVTNAELIRLRDTVTKSLPSVVKAQNNRLREQRLNRLKMEMEKRLDAACAGNNHAIVSTQLRNAFLGRDVPAYATALERLAELKELKGLQTQRQELLTKLGEVAPSWAGAVRYRQPPHDTGTVPGDVTLAWRWRQLHDELVLRDLHSVETLQDKVEELGASVRLNTAQLIEQRAWAAQVRRTTVPQRQALVGWVQTIRRIGRGTGKRVPQLLAEARRLMNQCRSAVPVWIMPLSRVVENFDTNAAQFDVVIIDEASQSDVMGLVAFFLGRQVIVVGDDQQVSPDAVGQRAEEVQHLIDEHLTGIPNANLYDGKFSVYDVAMSSFGGTICLREHFRCVPDIIRFSNYLSYNGAIKPLRDASSVNLRPAIVPFRVRGSETINSINENEALSVVSLIVAACEQPEYEDATFGVISMVGVHQAERIDSLLRCRLEPAEYERRRIVCGNAAHFQGDEREVMFLSMVNAPREGGPLTLQTQPAYQKRLNVAASRARDQMWVIHSLQADIDLKAGDLRRRFLEHVYDPTALQRIHENAESQVESEFERQVLQRLIGSGYRVVPQWHVGSFRIDLVVEGNGKRLAVECDGDRYHGLEQIPNDMARQALLERLGWKFARIRGSAFFRDPDAAMMPVWERLQSLGIEKLGTFAEQEIRVTDSSNLVERVIGRAAELRRKWLEQESSQDEASDGVSAFAEIAKTTE